MLDPFTDTTQKELREAWRRIEELEQENKNLKLDVATAVLKSVKLEQENEELREQLEKERELYYGDDDFAEEDWGRE